MQVFTDVRDNSDVWCVILTGEGNSFCAGRDLIERVDVGEHLPGPQSQDVYDMMATIYKPFIAAVNGPCIAQGCGLAFSSDVLIASETSYFSWPQVKRGVASISGPTMLTRFVPHQRAMELMFTGEPLSAEEARRWGLVRDVVSQDRVLAEARQVALSIVANAPLAVRAMKEATIRTMHMSGREAAEVAELILHIVDSSEDSREGLRAFKEKREPVWRAR